jgi:CRP-like cAMP-binding protein
MTPAGTVFQNRLLNSLSPADLSLLRPLLKPIDLPMEMVLEVPNEPIPLVYFPESGIASVVAGEGARIEVGLIGREGMSGLSIVMGDDRSVNSTFMQGGGAGFRVSTKDFGRALQKSDTLRLSLLRYAQVFSTQVAQTAVANGRAKLEARLARWLLMAHDRFDHEAFPFTHKFLALMLGVRRPGVTVALHFLEGYGLIKATRGLIAVVDRKGLEAHADASYGVPEAEYERLIGKKVRAKA